MTTTTTRPTIVETEAEFSAIPVVKLEQTGTTPFGDPEIVVSITEPHQMARWQLLLRSTASMDHLADERAQTGKTAWLVYDYPETPGLNGANGTIRATDIDDLTRQTAEFVAWLWRREQIRHEIDITELDGHVDRLSRALWDDSGHTINWELEWQGVLEQVARINMVMARYPAAAASVTTMEH